MPRRGSGAQTGLAEPELNRAHIGTGFQQVGGERVAQGMGGDLLAQPGALARLAAPLIAGPAATGRSGEAPGNSHVVGRTACPSSRHSASRLGESMMERSVCPLPCRT